MILTDTTPLVALCDGRDEKHDLAVKHLESLNLEGLAVLSGRDRSAKVWTLRSRIPDAPAKAQWHGKPLAVKSI